jgi:hypothetical protein
MTKRLLGQPSPTQPPASTPRDPPQAVDPLADPKHQDVRLNDLWWLPRELADHDRVSLGVIFDALWHTIRVPMPLPNALAMANVWR